MLTGRSKNKKEIKSGQVYPVLTVITVVYNCVSILEKTIQSVIGQTYKNIEYIIIDGNSTDGTIDVIKKYEDKITYWQSEPDNGVYDAMNKGILLSKGNYICFMNAGDVFSSSCVVENVFKLIKERKPQIIYGDSARLDAAHTEIICYSTPNYKLLKYGPIYRHGASFVDAEYHKRHLFQLDRKEIGFALDYLFIYEAYKNGISFEYVPINIMTYLEEGISNSIRKVLLYNHRITHSSCLNYLLKNLKYSVLGIKIIHKAITLIKCFYQNVIINYLINLFPVYLLRKLFLNLSGMKLGKKTVINMFCHFIAPWKLTTGNHCHINRYCFVDCRGGVTLGNNVSISYGSKIITGSHNINELNFPVKIAPIVINDYVWIGAGATILQNVRVGMGAVVCAGSVVTKDVPENAIMAGIPAKIIGKRKVDYKYQCIAKEPFL